MNPISARSILAIARANLGAALMQDSAELCASDAEALLAKGQPAAAARRALKSLQYSVGVFHPEYVRAARIIDPAY